MAWLVIIGVLWFILRIPASGYEVQARELYRGVDDPRLTRASATLIAAIDTFHHIPGCDVGCRLIMVPAGEFAMGDGRFRSGNIECPVELSHAFYLGQYEITNREYLEMAQWAYDNGLILTDSFSVFDLLGGANTLLMDMENEWSEIGFRDNKFYLRAAGSSHAEKAYPNGYDPADHPVKVVSWEGAAAFCDWLNLRAGLPITYDHRVWTCLQKDPYFATGYRLPTDAEWEYAARYPDGRLYPWGADSCDCTRANFDLSCKGWTTPVGSYAGAPVIGDLRFYDLLGNLWEWVHDWWEEIEDDTRRVDPVGPPSSDYRILRGGAWWPYAHDLRSSLRPKFPPDYKGGHIGIRIARSAEPRLRKEPVLPSEQRWK